MQVTYKIVSAQENNASLVRTCIRSIGGSIKSPTTANGRPAFIAIFDEYDGTPGQVQMRMARLGCEVSVTQYGRDDDALGVRHYHPNQDGAPADMGDGDEVDMLNSYYGQLEFYLLGPNNLRSDGNVQSGALGLEAYEDYIDSLANVLIGGGYPEEEAYVMVYDFIAMKVEDGLLDAPPEFEDEGIEVPDEDYFTWLAQAQSLNLKGMMSEA